MNTFARLKIPLFGRGQAKVQFSRDFARWKPHDQMTALEQTMKALRLAHAEAARNHKAALQAEDARNAAQIRRTA